MCLLSYIPEHVQPDLDELMNGAITNHDGHGYAIATHQGLIVRRTVDKPAALLDAFGEDRKTYPAGPALFHSRFATSGTKDKRNVHPFTVGRDSKTVLAHNGVFFRTKGNMSDTAVFAASIMPERFAKIDKPRVRGKLETYLNIAYPNKLAVITVNPRYRHQGYTFGQGEYSTTSGVWHSNDDYMPWESNKLWAADMAGPGNTGEFCSVCYKERTIDPVTLVCASCNYCQDCQEHIYDCLCYSPQAYDRPAITERTQWASEQARESALAYASQVKAETGLGWAGADVAIRKADSPQVTTAGGITITAGPNESAEELQRRVNAIVDAQAAFAAKQDTEAITQ